MINCLFDCHDIIFFLNQFQLERIIYIIPCESTLISKENTVRFLKQLVLALAVIASLYSVAVVHAADNDPVTLSGILKGREMSSDR